MERWDAIIVGAGPAGCATALCLGRLRSDAPARTLILEKSRHPRDKTCAGGLIAHVDTLLRPLDIELDALPQVPVGRIRIRTEGRVARLDDPGVARVVRRRDFDAFLAAEVRARGFEIREDEPALEVVREDGGIRIETARGRYWTRAVVAADGMGGLVRRRLFPGAGGPTSRMCMVDVPVDPAKTVEFREGAFSWDFECIRDGIAGYVWDFPTWIEGEPHLNVGIFDWEPRAERRRNLRESLLREIERRGFDPSGLAVRSWSARQYRRNHPFGAPGVVLAGDAAGIDPSMGEGISNAIEYGHHAAEALDRAMASGDYAFEGYSEAIRRSPLGRRLWALGVSAALVYRGLARPAIDLWARDPVVARATTSYFCRPDAPRELRRAGLATRGFVHVIRYGVETLRRRHPKDQPFVR